MLIYSVERSPSITWMELFISPLVFMIWRASWNVLMQHFSSLNFCSWLKDDFNGTILWLWDGFDLKSQYSQGKFPGVQVQIWRKCKQSGNSRWLWGIIRENLRIGFTIREYTELLIVNLEIQGHNITGSSNSSYKKNAVMYNPWL